VPPLKKYRAIQSSACCTCGRATQQCSATILSHVHEQIVALRPTTSSKLFRSAHQEVVRQPVNFEVQSCIHSDSKARVLILARDIASPAAATNQPEREQTKLHKMFDARMLTKWRSTANIGRGAGSAYLVSSGGHRAALPAARRALLRPIQAAHQPHMEGNCFTRPAVQHGPQTRVVRSTSGGPAAAACAAQRSKSAQVTALQAEYRRDSVPSGATGGISSLRSCRWPATDGTCGRSGEISKPEHAPRVSPEAITDHMQRLLGSAPERAAEGPDMGSTRAAQLASSPAADGAVLDQPFGSGGRAGHQSLACRSVHAGPSDGRGAKAGRAPAPCLAALSIVCAVMGMLSCSWAMPAVTPIHKGGDELDPHKYRGIALGTAIGTLHSTMLNQRLTAWLEYHQLQDHGQGGYRSNHRTQDPAAQNAG